MLHPFDALPDTARVWVYASEAPLDAQAQALVEATRTFIATWTSHARPVAGDALVAHGRFLVVGAFIADGEISGCGIDASVHAVEELGRRMGIRWMNSLSVAFRDRSGGVQVVDRPTFRRLVREGRVDPTTSVFDLAVNTVGAWRDGAFERPVANSWHATVFGLESVA